MKKTHKKHVALLTTLAVIVCTLFYTNTAKADTENSWDSSDVVKVSKCTVNGTERILTLYSDGSLFFKVKENGYSTILPDALDIGFDMEIVEKHHNLKLDAPSGRSGDCRNNSCC